MKFTTIRCSLILLAFLTGGRADGASVVTTPTFQTRFQPSATGIGLRLGGQLISSPLVEAGVLSYTDLVVELSPGELRINELRHVVTEPLLISTTITTPIDLITFEQKSFQVDLQINPFSILGKSESFSYTLLSSTTIGGKIDEIWRFDPVRVEGTYTIIGKSEQSTGQFSMLVDPVFPIDVTLEVDPGSFPDQIFAEFDTVRLRGPADLTTDINTVLFTETIDGETLDFEFVNLGFVPNGSGFVLSQIPEPTIALYAAFCTLVSCFRRKRT